MDPHILTGTLAEQISDNLANTPTEDLFHREHETVIRFVQRPDDPDWLAHAARWVDERSHKQIAMPPTQIPKVVGGFLTSLDDEPRFPPRFWDRIGQSGWNHVRSLASFLAFEFDSADGHKQGLTDARMREAEDILTNQPCIDLRRSTSGQGLHCRLFIAPQPCRSRDEYLHIRQHGVTAFLKRVGIGIDEVDLGGRGNLWIWRGGAA